MGVIEVKYFNSFKLRKVLNDNAVGLPSWGGSRGIAAGTAGAWPQVVNGQGLPLTNDLNWEIEEARIRGGYNNTTVQLGVKAYLVEDNPNASIRSSSMIYSGIFNSRTGVNDTNVFSIGEDIVKSADPSNGSIQRIYAEDSNLTIFQESKVSRALIDKDAIYSAEGGGTVTSSNLVIGTLQPYGGNYGISRNPESFATYGYRKYFTDKDRGVVLRLSKDGITEISGYGMADFFRDELGSLDANISDPGKAIGGWDIHNKQYVLSLQSSVAGIDYKTLSFDDTVNGFPSFFSYNPDQVVSIKNNYFSTINGSLYKHYTAPVRGGTSPTRGVFYGQSKKSSITFIFNPKVSASKVFKTVNYEGSNGWQVDSFVSDLTGVNTPNTVDSVANTRDIVGSVDSNGNALPIKVYSYNQGSYDSLGNEYGTGTTQLIPPIYHAGFDRKENKYMANLINNSPAAAGEVVWGNAMTGIKGYFATVTMATDSVTDPGGMKELFAVSSNYVESSY
jgi:hypothetical protein